MANLISYAYLRTETDISQNIPNKDLDNPIKRAEDQLKFLIGKSFYEQIVSQNNSESLTSDNNDFYDPYVKQFLAWQAYQYWVVKANISPTKTGMRTFTEDNSEVASDKAMGELIRDAKEAVNGYKGALLSFLRAQKTESSTKYPLYVNDGKASLSGGFHVTAITKKNTTSFKIDKEIFNNGE